MTPPSSRCSSSSPCARAGVTNADVLKAMEATPRAEFLEGIFQERAYEDTPLPIACGQTISQPTVVGLMTQALEVTRRCKVLEIGTGSGYQAAILVAARAPGLHRRAPPPAGPARARAASSGSGSHNITVVHGDGSLGLPEQAPFDRIIVTAAAEDPPQVAARPAARRAASWCCRSARATRSRR